MTQGTLVMDVRNAHLLLGQRPRRAFVSENDFISLVLQTNPLTYDNRPVRPWDEPYCVGGPGCDFKPSPDVRDGMVAFCTDNAQAMLRLTQAK